MSSGQHSGAKKTVALILSRLSGAVEITGGSAEKRLGDVKMEHQGQTIFIEVKRDQLAQVRAIACKVVVFHLTKTNELFVIPPDDIMELANNRSRGQHTEIQYECCHLGQLKKDLRNKYLVKGDLHDAVVNAYLQGESSGVKNKAEKMMKLILECKKKCQELL